MLWVLKRTVSRRRSFEHPKQMFKLMGKKIIRFYANKISLSGPMDNAADIEFSPRLMNCFIKFHVRSVNWSKAWLMLSCQILLHFPTTISSKEIESTITKTTIDDKLLYLFQIYLTFLKTCINIDCLHLHVCCIEVLMV